MKECKTARGRKMAGVAQVLLGLAAAVVVVAFGKTVDVTAQTNPANPVHHCTKDTDSTGNTDTTTWSYVYFGSYPQSEVTGDALTSAITGAVYDANGDAWVNGTKYRRISKSDTNNDSYFGSSTYRYFKWERIKWRVLGVNGSTMFVVADKGLDCKYYHDPGGSITWENCTLRSWLNNDFYGTAFSSSEQGAVVSQTILNEDNPYNNTEGGNNTTDKVYLLSLSEVMNPDYGFCEDYSTYSVSRRVQVSNYAHARGAYVSTNTDYARNSWWWLRSPGYYSYNVARVINYGYVYSYGYHVLYYYDACVPALHINLSSDLWSTTDDGTSGSGGDWGNVAPSVIGLSDQVTKTGNSKTFSVSVSGGNPSNYTYQWYYATSQSGTGTRISGATSSSYTITSSNMTSGLNGRYYYCVVSNGQYEVESGRAKLTVYSAPSVTAPSDRSVKFGTGTTFSVTASGGNPSNYTYQWYYATSRSGTGIRISGATSSSYTISSSNMTSGLNGRYYYCIVSNGQYEVESGRAKLTVYLALSVIAPSSQSVKSGTSVTFGVTASGGSTSNYSYQWYYAASQSGAGTRISGATSSTYTIAANNVNINLNGRYYYCVVSSGQDSVTSSRAILTVQADDTTEPVSPPDGNQTGGNQNTGGGSHVSGGLKRQTINAVSRTVVYQKKAFSLGISTNGNGRLTYQSSNPKVAAILSDGKIKIKNFGTAVITINASQTASYAAASKQITIQVVPKKGGLKQASSPYGRCIKLAWKKDKKAGGYEVQISMSKSFQSKTIKRLYKKGKTDVTLIGLQSKKKYYVRVRSYAKAGKRKVYGDWSKARTVKIR